MAAGRPHLNRRTAIFVIAGTVVLGGAALLARAPHAGKLPLAAKHTPTVTATASPASGSAAEATPAPSSEAAAATPGTINQPVVAGASTSTSFAPKVIAKAAPAATSTPVPVQTISLTIIDPSGTHNFSVRLQTGADACSVLEQAKAEGKISVLDIDYSYLHTSLKSAYVRQINSYANNWTVKVNGAAPLGCSLVSPKPNDNVTWRYQ